MEINILMEFQYYSHSRPDLKNALYPNLQLRSWTEVRESYSELLDAQLYQVWNFEAASLLAALELLQLKYRRINFGFTPSEEGVGYYFDIEDALQIALYEEIDDFFFYELLSIYFNIVVKGDRNTNKLNKLIDICESIFSQFGVNMMIRNNQFVPRQSEKIVTEIYDPTFQLLKDSTYDGVNNELNKAFESFRAKDYNDVIVKSINAVQAALQVLVDGEVNQKKKINVLLKEAKNNQLLSDYELTNTIYLNINSFLERIRKDKAGVHPTNGSANQNDALFVINLTMVLLQNLILNNNRNIQG